MSDFSTRPPLLARSGILPIEDAVVRSTYAGGLTRRGFLSASALAAIAATLAACGSEGATGPGVSIPTGVTLTGTTTTISLVAQPGLANTGGYLIIANAGRSLIVVNLGGTTYRALSAVCTHEGCLISGMVSNTIVCNCHNSSYTTGGAVLGGPARGSLALFQAVHDPVANTVVVSA